MEVPRLISKLYPFQEESKNFCLKNDYSILNMIMGSGKSVTSLAAACEIGGKVLIACPAYLRDNWKNEVKKHTEGLDVEIVSYAGLRKMTETDASVIISDECHALKNPQAKRTKAFHSLVLTSKPKKLILLSGSIIKNNVPELWSLLQLCHYGGQYGEFDPYYKLYYKFCNTFSYERTFEVNRIPIIRFEGVKNVEKLKELMRVVCHRVGADSLADLPESNEIYMRSVTKTPKDILDFLNSMFKEEGKLSSLTNDPAYMSMKRANAIIKVDTTIRLAKEMIEQGEKVVIFSDHVRSCELISEALSIKPITGKMPAQDRSQLVQSFEDGATGAICATIGALSTGVNLVSSSKMIINDYPFVPADLEQAKARIRRIGQTKKCFYYYIVSSETDQGILDKLKRKTNDINKVY